MKAVHIYGIKSYDHRRGVKEKNKDVATNDGVSSAMTEEPVVKEKQGTSVDISIPNVENTDLRSYPPLPMQGFAPTGKTLSISSYTNVTDNTPDLRKYAKGLLLLVEDLLLLV
nr:hypothetical protein [Tanacetum cinerariifolium]